MTGAKLTRAEREGLKRYRRELTEHHSGAVSRTYYAALHAVKAALYIQDVTAESHAAVGRMFAYTLSAPARSNPSGLRR